MTSKRKVYVREMSPTWWQKLGFYRFYMLREGTALPAVWFSIVLMYGVFALKNGPEGWAGFVGFLQNPLVLLINVIALLAAALHTKTWFDLAPKASIIVVKDEKMAPEPIVRGLWLVTVIITVAVLAIALLY
ncbi:fumarate reductase subunit FrdC [Affinibrenneria salicis]|uniref:Fumarate reductase subunit C n=1 Tax=Affinibrenneria salicis TaxID=2590031 RepID=A0A5J5FQU7_9GAMM|nr:fumarate reductase subunit FrdC [Affinibrenneria salicis]KAA8995400.1 fumarate reductase subunit FrdC [Affinibrenneria salicis]